MHATQRDSSPNQTLGHLLIYSFSYMTTHSSVKQIGLYRVVMVLVLDQYQHLYMCGNGIGKVITNNRLALLSVTELLILM